jgi:hypothetical protein
LFEKPSLYVAIPTVSEVQATPEHVEFTEKNIATQVLEYVAGIDKLLLRALGRKSYPLGDAH